MKEDFENDSLDFEFDFDDMDFDFDETLDESYFIPYITDDLNIETYYLDEIFESLETYNQTKEKIKDALKKDYQLRKKKVCFSSNGLDSIQMTLGRAFLNILLLRPFAKFKLIPSEKDLFPYNSVTQDSLEKYFNYILNKFKNMDGITHDQLRLILTESIDELVATGANYNVKVGNSISLTDILKLEEEDPEFDALTHTKIKPGQYSAIEKQFNETGSALMKYFKDHKTTELHPFVASETGLNKKQFCQAVG